MGHTHPFVYRMPRQCITSRREQTNAPSKSHHTTTNTNYVLTFPHFTNHSSKTIRKVNAALLTPQKILVSDKFGDVYTYSTTSTGPHLLLGHVSMTLDLKLSPFETYLLTCDRDEKVRVSMYPNTYNIHGFVLGHEEMVSTIMMSKVHPHVVYSCGLDGFMLVCDYVKCVELERMNYGKEGKVAKMVTSVNDQRMAVWFEECKTVLVYDLENVKPKLVQEVECDEDVFNVCFDGDMNLWIGVCGQSQIYLSRCSGGQYSIPSKEDTLVCKFNALKLEPEHAFTDFYPLTKLTKQAIKTKGDEKLQHIEKRKLERESKKIKV